jgi:hypothetical protein
MITEWDSQFPGIGLHLRTIYRDGYTCTVYEPSTRGNGAGSEAALPPTMARPTTDIMYGGSEGELYNHADDPHQWRNLWNDPAFAAIKSHLIDDLYRSLPAERSPRLKAEAPT